MSRRKNLVQYVIQRNDAEKFFDTRPELAFDELCSKVGIETHGKLCRSSIYVDGWSIRPDRHIRGTNVVIEIDGPYHDTAIQRRKTEWRDEQMTSYGVRVFHIPSELLIAEGFRDRKRFWPYVLFALTDFLLSTDKVRRMVA